MFRKKLLTFGKPLENDIYGPLGVTLFYTLHLGFHLKEHKFRYDFADVLNPLHSCPLETEDTNL